MRWSDSALKGSLAVEGMEHDAFEQVAQGHVVILGERLEHFENALFHAHAGLDAFDEEVRFIVMVRMYHGTEIALQSHPSARVGLERP